MFHKDIKELTKENLNFREVLETGEYAQLVVMNIPKGGEIGEEIHTKTDQILFLVDGEGEVILNDEVTPFKKHQAVYVKAGTKHNFKNTGETDLKLYTVYAPPAHKAGTVHKTFEEALADEEDHN